MKKSQAFSLIELSIVILIIGILIAGVTQGSRLLAQSKLKTAQTLTQSSPVNGNRGLVLWLESTSDASFISSQADEGVQLSQWNDINPQSISKYFAVKTASDQALYEVDGINGLPTVLFGGAAGSAFTISTSTSTANATPIVTNNNSFTFFAVAKLDSTVTSSDTASRYLFNNGNSGGSNGWGYLRYGSSTAADNGKRSLVFQGITWNFTSTANSTTNAEVISATYDKTSGAVALYTNGNSENISTPVNSINTPTGSFIVGNSWKGFISEIIVFDGALKNADRIEIERYLGKKYGIKVR